MEKELFTIAERIKMLRNKKNITQSDLAKMLGLTRSGVNAWEMGLSVPSAQYIVALAKLFDVSTDYLLGLDDTSTISINGLTQAQVAAVIGIIQCFRNPKQ